MGYLIPLKLKLVVVTFNMYICVHCTCMCMQWCHWISYFRCTVSVQWLTFLFSFSFPSSFLSVYIEMADLLRDFDNPSVMDIKMGTRYIQWPIYTSLSHDMHLLSLVYRTYLEDELVKARVKEVLRPVSVVCVCVCMFECIHLCFCCIILSHVHNKSYLHFSLHILCIHYSRACTYELMNVRVCVCVLALTVTAWLYPSSCTCIPHALKRTMRTCMS